MPKTYAEPVSTTTETEEYSDEKPVSLEEKYPDVDFEKLTNQVKNEIQIATDFMTPKLNEWYLRLKVYNNQRRDKDKVGDPLMFTVFNTVLASLYEDQLMVEFNGREEGDTDSAENLNALAEYDRVLMEKDMIDYEWDWDTCFFGRGLVLNHEFDREDKVPVPEVIDPMSWLRDPRAQSVNGVGKKRRGAMRFGGNEMWLTKWEMEENQNFFNIDCVDSKGDKDSLVQKARTARADAQGTQENPNKQQIDIGDNEEYSIFRWFTHTKIGEKYKKVIVWVANNGSDIIRLQELKGNLWPINDRSLYATAHDWDGVSIPDLVEDKQRMRAVLNNLGIDTIKADLYPMYVYDKNKIKNRNDLNFGFNKFIPVDGVASGVVQPFNKANANSNLLSFILDTLDQSAQRATATPEVQQGAVSGQQRTLGELNLVASKVDTRYTLSMKIFGWSEKRFWEQWYRLYKEHYADKIDEKIVRIVGFYGNEYRPLNREDIIPTIDPDVSIESQTLSKERKFIAMQQFDKFQEMAIQYEGTNKRYLVLKAAKLVGLSNAEIEHLMPPTLDELIAESENDQLNINKRVAINAKDDHVTHLMIHSKAKTTKWSTAHIQAHKKALLLMRDNPEMFEQDADAQDETTPTTGEAGNPPTALPSGAPPAPNAGAAPAPVGVPGSTPPQPSEVAQGANQNV